MTPLHVRVRVPRTHIQPSVEAVWQAGTVTFVVGADGPRRDALLLLLAAMLELPHHIRKVDPMWMRIAPCAVTAYTYGKLIGPDLASATCWKNPAIVELGGASVRLWGVGCDFQPDDSGARGVLCNPAGDLFLGGWDCPLMGSVSSGMLLAPSVDTWGSAAREVVSRSIAQGSRVILSGRQVPSWVRSIRNLREVLVPSSSRIAIAR